MFFEIPTVAYIWKVYYKLLQIWKIIDKRWKTRSMQSVMKFVNFIFNV